MTTEMKKTTSIDMLNGPLLKNIIKFSIPISISGMLQLLFNLTDMAVVGRFAENSEVALAAVGSNGPLINILIQFFMGFSIGVNIVVARHIGAKNRSKVFRATHTAIPLAIIFGIFVEVVGLIFCRDFLNWLQVPDNVIDYSESYMRIYFLGVPFLMVYNFGSAILRANGETKKPLYFLAIGGIINVILNIILVKFFSLDVEGVAIATCASELISSVLVFIDLLKRKDQIRLFFKRIRLYKTELIEIITDGLPAGVHSSMYSIANVIIQSEINAFGHIAMAANSAAFNITGIVSTGYYGIVNAATTFTSQNTGAKKYERIPLILRDCILSVCVYALIGSGVIFLFEKQLISIFNTNPDILASAHKQLLMVGGFLFLDGSVATFAGVIRGMGKSFQSMAISIIGICGVRLLYLFTFYPLHKDLLLLYLIYPISWLIALIINIIYYAILTNKQKKLKEI